MMWAVQTQDLFQKLKTRLFSDLKSGEMLSLNLTGEDSLYVRLNHSRVRQNTQVQQQTLELLFQAKSRRVSLETDLTGDLESDTSLCLGLIARARQEAEVLPEDPGATDFINRGHSQFIEDSRELDLDQVLSQIQMQAQDSDLTGILASGPMVRANANHLGQSHWFSTRSFFLDYSLFTKNDHQENKAVKTTYSDKEWNESKFYRDLSSAKNQLSMLKKPNHEVTPGAYRVYLAPAAASELFSMLNWGAFSFGAYKRGHSAFAKLADQNLKLSPLFSLRENFNLGLTTPFNSWGETPTEEVSVIEKGELKNWLINSRSAQEFSVTSNFASESEAFRSMEVLPGTLEEKQILQKIGTGLYLSHLHYCNWSDLQTARVTGMTRYACFWVENGEIVAPIRDLRFDISLFEALGDNLEALSAEAVIDPSVETYFHRALGGKKLPGLLIRDFKFTL